MTIVCLEGLRMYLGYHFPMTHQQATVYLCIGNRHEGVEITDDNRGVLGKVKDVYKSGSQYIAMIQRPGKQDLLVPFVKDIFYEVNPSESIIKCRLPEGLFELYDV